MSIIILFYHYIKRKEKISYPVLPQPKVSDFTPKIEKKVIIRFLKLKVKLRNGIAYTY